MNLADNTLLQILALIIFLGLVIIILTTNDKETKKIATITLVLGGIIWILLAFIYGPK